MTPTPQHLPPKPASRRVSRWGEGPFWHNQALWYVDIEDHALVRFDPATGTEEAWDIGQRIGFVRPRASGELLWGGDQGLFLFNPQTATSRLIPGTAPESPDHRYNDADVAPDGFLFAGTISLRKQTGSANLYRLGPDLQRSLAFANVTNSNGIGWSPDGLHAYYIDTPRRCVLRFEYARGLLQNPQVFLDTTFIDASPDGLCLDRDGHLWIAFCHGGCVMRFHGQHATLLDRIDFPCVETTACCFGGGDLRDLYVTTGLHRSKTEADAGRLFVVRGLPTPGLPRPLF